MDSHVLLSYFQEEWTKKINKIHKFVPILDVKSMDSMNFHKKSRRKPEALFFKHPLANQVKTITGYALIPMFLIIKKKDRNI